ncbi:MAG: hypothetical protein ACLU38_15865 [Dysosmobacter sp.]
MTPPPARRPSPPVVDALGENRVQEMAAKLAENAYDGAPAALYRPSAAQQGEAGGGQGRAHPVRRLRGAAG